MFERIFIDNYKCFTNFEFVPGRINLLLGPNGSGKSSLFDVLGLVSGFVGGVHVEELFHSSSLTRWGKEHTQTFELDVRLSGKLFQYKLVIHHGSESVVSTESVLCDGKVLCLFDGRMIFSFQDDGRTKALFPWEGTRSVLSHSNLVEKTCLSEFVLFLRGNPENNSLTDFPSLRYYWLRQGNPKNLELLTDLLRHSNPGFCGLELKRCDLYAKMTSGGLEYELQFEELSVGQQDLINLFGLLARGTCLLLDNPGTNLGPSDIHPWLVQLTETFTSQGQVFVASHHPEVIDYMASCQPFWFDRPEGGSVRVRPALFDRESGVSASEQIRRGFEE